jgi:hypothetical protein
VGRRSDPPQQVAFFRFILGCVVLRLGLSWPRLMVIAAPTSRDTSFAAPFCQTTLIQALVHGAIFFDEISISASMQARR